MVQVEIKSRDNRQSLLVAAMIIVAFWAVFGAFFVMPANAQTDTTYQLADMFAKNGDGPRAERAYDDILESHPGDYRALLGRATTRSWQGKKELAEADFNQILSGNPNDLGALVGLGYNFAWVDRFSDAEDTFKRALDVAPDNPGALKGLGYTYLWNDQPELAQPFFHRAASADPEDAEAHTAIAQSELRTGHTRRAVKAYKDALRIEPSRRDAVQGLRAAYGAPAPLELSVWAGTSSGGGDTGIRLVELASWIGDSTRLSARFDDSLSLDNPALARGDLDARTYYGSVLQKFGENWLGLGEFGFRDLPDGANQEIYKLEATRLFNGQAIKLGGQISPHSDGFNDVLAYTGYNFPVGERWRVEPSVFYSNTGGTNDDEWRGVLFTEFRDPRGWSFGTGLGGGYIDSNVPGVSGGVFIANANASVPFAGYHLLHASVRYEENPINDFVVAQLGVTLRLPRK